MVKAYYAIIMSNYSATDKDKIGFHSFYTDPGFAFYYRDILEKSCADIIYEVTFFLEHEVKLYASIGPEDTSIKAPGTVGTLTLNAKSKKELTEYKFIKRPDGKEGIVTPSGELILSLQDASDLLKKDKKEEKKMLYGKTPKETLELNGWGVGDVLEGYENGVPNRIRITAIGEESFLCRWSYLRNGDWEECVNESGDTSLNLREWKKLTRSNYGDTLP